MSESQCSYGALPGACEQQGLKGYIVRQFGQPAGLLGWAAGQIMAVKNRGRSLWVISLLDIQRDDRVLEIGFGPGVDLRRVSEIAADGFVTGVDHSKEMVR